MNRHSVLQRRGRRGGGAFDVTHYKPLKKYLVVLGQYPSQTDFMNKSIVIVMVGSMVTLVIPSMLSRCQCYLALPMFPQFTVLQFYVSISDKNLDGAIETLPHLVTLCIALIKLLSMHFNRENFRKVFLTVESDWDNPVFTKDMDVLEEITGKGVKIANVYRCALLSFFGSFVTLPLCNPMLDIIMPLNETRGRKELFSLYYFVNNDDHFYTIYVHSVWCGLVTMITIVTVDSLNMIITHHASALFAICGCMIEKATECNDVATMGRASTTDGLEKIRECVVAHNKAIQFFDFLDGTNRMTFLLQVGFNMIGTSVTAFQAVMHLDDTKEAVRYAIFFGGQKFHLYFLSLPGQILSEYSTGVLDHIYGSKWYRTSAKMQRVMNIMQLRASKRCQLTAGGLYEMNIENFGAAFKTCMSYLTMLLSMKE